ncbi:MAG TPA: ribosome maturation factor RimM [Candidatus Acidoferrales bacterium]|nr:ribosome maturation factor RimM [Candidatus Acidoferrales bacterium]
MPRKPPHSTTARPTRKNELPIGRIAGLFGVRGELKCDPTSAGRAVFVPGARLQCATNGTDDTVTIASVREHKGRLLIALEGSPDATSAQRFVGATFYAPREALDVGADEYLDVDLVGCSVIAHDGSRYGSVERVEHYPASDMLVVNGRLLPMVRAFIRSIDTTKKEIVVNDLPQDLLD